MNPRISIIISNWNGLNDTIECLESLKKITYPNYEVIVVDNGSKGNDADVLEEKYKGYIRVIRNKENLGFAGGNNLGIKLVLEEGKSDYILLLNNDTVVEPDFLNHLVKTAQKNPKIGIVGGLAVNYYDRLKDRYRLGKLNLFKGGVYYISYENFALEEYFVNFIAGCLMLINIQMIQRIGLLPEEYFLTFEDTEYCLRALKHGYKLVVNVKAVIYHKVSRARGGEENPLHVYYANRNRIYFMLKKVKNPFYVIPFLFFFFFTRCIKIFQLFFVYKSFDHIKALLVGTWHGLIGHMGEFRFNQ